MKQKTLGISEGIRELVALIESVSKRIIDPFRNFVNMGYPKSSAPAREHRNYRINLCFRTASLFFLIAGTLMLIKFLFF